MTLNDTVSIAARPPTVAEQVYILAGRMGDLEHEVSQLRAQCKSLKKKGAQLHDVIIIDSLRQTTGREISHAHVATDP